MAKEQKERTVQIPVTFKSISSMRDTAIRYLECSNFVASISVFDGDAVLRELGRMVNDCS